jgi:peptidoglycan/LPS O-acetylase OafA/YrhL
MATPVQPQPPAIRALTGVRWFAALWVVLFHFGPNVQSILPVWHVVAPISSVGLIGVDLFFFLSGFILAYNYLAQFARFDLSRYRHFLALRLARIYPVYLVTLLIVLVVLVASRADHTSIFVGHMFGKKGFVENLFMVNAWNVRHPVLGWDFPAWSVSAEWFAYLLFPLAAFVVYRVTSRAVSLVAAAALIGAYIVLSGPGHLDGPIVRIACDFLCGMFLFRVYEAGVSGRVWQWLAPAGLCLAIPIMWLSSGLAEGYLLVADCAVVVFGLAVSRGVVATFLGGPALIFLGEVSYSLYMTHGLIYIFQEHVLTMTHHIHSGLAVRVGLVGFYAVVIFVAAVAMYEVVEKPSRSWIRSRIRAPHLRSGV